MSYSSNESDFLLLELNLVPEAYLSGRYDAVKRRRRKPANKCPKGQHFVRRKGVKSGGYCRDNPRGKKTLNSPGSELSSQQQSPDKAAAIGAGIGGLAIGGIGGAIAYGLANSDSSKRSAERELKRTELELERTQKLNQKLKLAESRSGGINTTNNKAQNIQNVKGLRGKITSLESTVKKQSQDLANQARNLTKRESALSKARDQVLASRSEIQSLRKQVKAYSKNIDQLVSQSARERVTVSRNQQIQEEVNQDVLQRQKAEGRGQKILREKAEFQLQGAQQKIRQLQSQLKSGGNPEGVKRLQKELSQWESAAKSAQALSSQKSRELGSLKKENARLLKDADQKLESKEKELTKVNQQLEKTLEEVKSLKESLLIFPVPKPGGYVKDPRTNKRPVPVNRNRTGDREAILPEIAEANPAKAKRSLQQSLRNTQEWQQILREPPPDPPLGRVKKKIGETTKEFRDRLRQEPEADEYENIDRLLDDASEFARSDNVQPAKNQIESVLSTEWGQDAKQFINQRTGKAKPIQELDSLPLRYLRKSVAEGRELNRRELTDLFAEEVTQFKSSPLQYIQKGSQADKAVFDQLKKLRKSGRLEEIESNLGQRIPTSRLEILAKASGLSSEDVAAIAGSLTGSSVGGTIGGLPGAIIGDLTGAETARKAAIDIQSVNAVRDRLKEDDLYPTLNKLEKLQYARMLTLIEVYERSNKQGRSISGDIGGAIAGNTVGAIGSAAGIPGAAVTLVGSLAGYKGAKGGNIAYDKIKGGQPKVEAIPEELLEFLFPQRPGVIKNTKKNYKRLGKIAKLIKDLNIEI